MAQGWKRDYTRYKSFFLNVLNAYNSKPNLRIYLELILSLGTIIIFSIFAIKPTILTIIEINNEIKTKEETISKINKKIADLKTISGLLQTQSQNLILIDEAVPDESQIDSLINRIETFATGSSVELKSLGSSDLLIKGSKEVGQKNKDLSSLPDNPEELPITFSVSGDYSNLFLFLQSIEGMRRPLKFDTFIFNTTKSSEDAKVITLTIAGRAPFLIPNRNIETKK